jgi:ABC-type uncharacterized transport system permease subunit
MNDTEKNLNFTLCQNYDLLTHRLIEENKRLESRPTLISVPTFCLFFVFGQSELKYETDIFLFFLILSISLFFFFRYKYKPEITSNKEYIERWIKEKSIQTSYVSFLHKLESDYKKRTNISFVDTIQKN